VVPSRSAATLGDLDLLTSWPATGLGPEGLSKSGSVEKKGRRRLSPAALASWFSWALVSPEGMSKSGSCTENVQGPFFVAELEGLPKSPGRGEFRERPES